MVLYTVIIPQRNAGVAVSRQLPELCDVLEALAASFELICVDDGSSPAVFESLEEQLTVCPALRLVRLDRPHGVGAALTAGIAAARGDVLIAVEAGDQYPADQIPKLLDRLDGADLVCGRRPSAKHGGFWRRLSNVPRWPLPTAPVDDPSCLFWAARHEAVAGLDLCDGMADYISSLVAARGYRVDQVSVTTGGRKPSTGGAWASPADLLRSPWRACRRAARPAMDLCEAADHLPPMKLDVPLGSDASLLPDAPKKSA